MAIVLKDGRSWRKGLTKDTDPRVAAGTLKLKESISTGKYVPYRTKHSEETRQRIREIKNALYASGWECTAGRTKWYEYESLYNGKVWVQGTWELAVVQYLDKNGFHWKRCSKRFPFIKPDGRPSTYLPDFFVEELGAYLEIKGYETKLDRAKWSQFPEPLVIWKKDKIREIFRELGVKFA